MERVFGLKKPLPFSRVLFFCVVLKERVVILIETSQFMGYWLLRAVWLERLFILITTY
jgi:hypothetical protein